MINLELEEMIKIIGQSKKSSLTIDEGDLVKDYYKEVKDKYITFSKEKKELLDNSGAIVKDQMYTNIPSDVVDKINELNMIKIEFNSKLDRSITSKLSKENNYTIEDECFIENAFTNE